MTKGGRRWDLVLTLTALSCASLQLSAKPWFMIHPQALLWRRLLNSAAVILWQRSRPGSRSEYILPAVAEKDCKEWRHCQVRIQIRGHIPKSNGLSHRAVNCSRNPPSTAQRYHPRNLLPSVSCGWIVTPMPSETVPASKCYCLHLSEPSQIPSRPWSVVPYIETNVLW